MKLAASAALLLALGACSNQAAPPPAPAAQAPAPEAKKAPAPEPASSAAPSKEELKKKLTPEQYYVCVMKGTEKPFNNKFWDFKGDGVYHCVACGLPLFDSKTKYDSKSGWPSFWETARKENLKTAVDHDLGYPRTEVMCKCGSHLGHVFDDGPPPTGLRYCINSASLEFKTR